MYIFYHKPIICCAIRLTAEIAIQQQAPKVRAAQTDFNNYTIFVLRPIATMAIVIKYLEIVLKILKN